MSSIYSKFRWWWWGDGNLELGDRLSVIKCLACKTTLESSDNDPIWQVCLRVAGKDGGTGVKAFSPLKRTLCIGIIVHVDLYVIA